jgi:uncharacterized protein (TIRG00374 family)
VALQALRSPSKVALIFLGNLAAQILLAAILGLCLDAFGQHANLADLILVNTFVSLFAGFMPVPGGIGVAEAGYTAGLAALGIPHAAALSTTLAFRIVTFYLPPIWGRPHCGGCAPTRTCDRWPLLTCLPLSGPSPHAYNA